MKLLITKKEYQSHRELSEITSNHEHLVVNGVDFVDCKVNDVNSFEQIQQGLNANNYVAGVPLPPSAFKK